MFREQQDLTSVIFTEEDRKARDHEDPNGGECLGAEERRESLRIREDIKGCPVRFHGPHSQMFPLAEKHRQSIICVAGSRASCLASLLSKANVPVGKALH